MVLTSILGTIELFLGTDKNFWGMYKCKKECFYNKVQVQVFCFIIVLKKYKGLEKHCGQLCLYKLVNHAIRVATSKCAYRDSILDVQYYVFIGF